MNINYFHFGCPLALFVGKLLVTPIMPRNALMLCEVPKKNEAKRGFFLEIYKTAIIRKGSASSPLCSRLVICEGWGLESLLPTTEVD
jgi:hypothetical protein